MRGRQGKPTGHTVQYLTTGGEWINVPLTLNGLSFADLSGNEEHQGLDLGGVSLAVVSGEDNAREIAINMALRLGRPTRILNWKHRPIAQYNERGEEVAVQR